MVGDNAQKNIYKAGGAGGTAHTCLIGEIIRFGETLNVRRGTAYTLFIWDTIDCKPRTTLKKNLAFIGWGSCRFRSRGIKPQG